MHKIKLLSLRNKIILFTLTLVFCLQGISTVIQIYQIKHVLFGNMGDKAINSSSEFVNELNKNLAVLNTKEEKINFLGVYANLEGKIVLDQVLNNISELGRVEFLNSGGKILLEESRTAQMADPVQDTIDTSVKKIISGKVTSTLEEGGNFIVSVPVKIEGDVAGYLVFYYSDSSLLIQQNELFALNIIFLIIFLMISVFVSILISNRITKPIFELKRSAEKLGKGDLDIHIDTYANDELGELAVAFNQMTDDLKKAGEHSKKLEDELVVKNKDLSEKVDDLFKAQTVIINAAKASEEEKQRTITEKDKIDAILHSIGDGVFVVDKDLKVTLVNEVAARMSGYSVDEILGLRFDERFKFVLEDTRKPNDQFLYRAIEDKTVQQMSNHSVLIDRFGNKISVADSAAPLFDKDNNVVGCSVVFRDVSRERMIDRSKSEFVSLASHQLRTPLTIINWCMEMLMGSDLKKLDEKQKDYLNEIHSGSQRMVKLVDGLLDIAHIEAGKLKIEPKLAYLDNFIEGIIDEMGFFLKKNPCSIFFNRPEKRLPEVAFDQIFLHQVIKNILINAIQYSSEGSCSVSISLEEKGDDYVISVADQGIGIPKEDKRNIFGRFFRANNAREKTSDGSGIGLYISKMIMESAGGKIWFESPSMFKQVGDKKVGYGTVFYVSIPSSGMRCSDEKKMCEDQI